MSSDSVWEPFHRVVAAPFEQAERFKESTGRSIIGHLLPDIPEEILHAANATPMAIEGARVQPSLAQAHIPSYTCNHAMGAVELGLKGQLDSLAGMIVPYTCDTTRNLYHIWGRLFPDMPTEFFRTPKRLDFDGVRDYLRAEFERLYGFACGLTGAEPSEQALTESIRLYNTSRRRLREAYDLHRAAPEVWTAARVHALLISAAKMPRELHLEWMDSLPWRDTNKTDGHGRIPLYVRGKVWDPIEVLDLLDELEFVITSDEIVTGYRAVAADATEEGDPLTALADRHLAMIPYAGYHRQPAKLVQDFVDRVKTAQAAGVLILNPKFCEAAGFDTPDFVQGLTDASIPSLILETSTRGVSMGQLRLRIEAFKEMLSSDMF